MRYRTDRSSFEVKKSNAFAATWDWGDAVDIRDHRDGATAWLMITDITGVSEVEIGVDTSDDGVTIPFSETALVRSDDSITDGTFKGFHYIGKFTVADGTLVVGPLSFRVPRWSGKFKVGVKADAADGAYSVRVQRFN